MRYVIRWSILFCKRNSLWTMNYEDRARIPVSRSKNYSWVLRQHGLKGGSLKAGKQRQLGKFLLDRAASPFHQLWRCECMPSLALSQEVPGEASAEVDIGVFWSKQNVSGDSSFCHSTVYGLADTPIIEHNNRLRVGCIAEGLTTDPRFIPSLTVTALTYTDIFLWTNTRHMEQPTYTIRRLY